MKFIRISFLLFTYSLFFASLAGAQPEEYNHPELLWSVHETEHFLIHYHQGTERTARELAQIAEEIFPIITSIYDYVPDKKTSVIVRDHDDYSNGGAYYYDNKIVIWATALDFDLRGTHNWLRNVMTHEFTHLIQLGAARKGPRWLPAFYFQWVDYEEEKRPDVLYGYPNVLASYPLPNTIIPPWFAEGCSQTQQPGLSYEHWDSHRDMILRTRVLEGKLLTYTEMGYYGKTSLNAESVYNHGFSLVRYIVDNWGLETLQWLSADMRKPLAFTFDQALKKRLGLTGEQLYDQWSKYLQRRYTSFTETVRAHTVTGRLLEEEGFANLYPRWSPDGKYIAFTSNKGSDYFGTSGLFLFEVEKGKSELLYSKPIHCQLAFSPDGRFIFYHRQFDPGTHGSQYDDLAAWDRKEKREIRLTRARRAAQVDISPDGKRLAFVVNGDGTENLWVANLADDWWTKIETQRVQNFFALTHYAGGEQIHSPRWSPDGASLVYAENRERNRDLFLIDVATAEQRPLLTTSADERDPSWVDQNSLFFVSDRTGIFNLYLLNLNSMEITPVSNVLGGAFMPHYSSSRQVAFSEYHATGYKLAVLDSLKSLDHLQMVYFPNYIDSLPEVNYSTASAPELPAKPYKPTFDKTFILPRIAMDFGTFKPGFYFYFQDILEQMNAFGGLAVNTRKDYDAFAILEYKKMDPTIFVEAYNVVRHTSQSFVDPYVIVGEDPPGGGPNAVPIYEAYSIDYSFNLLEVDLGVKMKLKDEIDVKLAGILSRYRTNLKLDDASTFGYTYFKGKTLEATLTADYRAPGRHEDIAPTGGHFVQLKAARNLDDFINGFSVNADKGTLQEVYTPYRYYRLQFVGDKYLRSPLHPRHSLIFTADLGYIDQPVDNFFHLYAGGLDGMRGYSYYSLGGTRKAIGRITYSLPLWSDVGKQFAFISLDKIYLLTYGDFGNAWTGEFQKEELKTDAGLGIKAQLYSFTTFPTALTVDAAYGFNDFQVEDSNGFHDYGKEWRFYFTLLFNFNLRHGDSTALRHRF